MNTSSVWIVLVLDRDCTGPVERFACSTKEKALSRLASYCRQQWTDQGQDEELPDDNEKAVEEYFGFWEPELTLYLDELAVDEEAT